MTRAAIARKKFWRTVLGVIITLIVVAFAIWLVVRSSQVKRRPRFGANGSFNVGPSSKETGKTFRLASDRANTVARRGYEAHRKSSCRHHFKCCDHSCAACVLLGHNDPSGVAIVTSGGSTPSTSKTTKRPSYGTFARTASPECCPQLAVPRVALELPNREK